MGLPARTPIATTTLTGMAIMIIRILTAIPPIAIAIRITTAICTAFTTITTITIGITTTTITTTTTTTITTIATITVRSMTTRMRAPTPPRSSGDLRRARRAICRR